MKRLLSFFLCLCMIFALCACAGTEPQPTPRPTETEPAYTPVTFKNHGRSITVTKLPEKVVTAGPNCTEIFCALGLEDYVTGKFMENHSQGALPELAQAVESIPTIFEGYPSLKDITDSGCDFIYASSWIFGDELSIDDLEDAGITVYVSEAADLESLRSELRDLAKIFGSDAEALISAETARLDAVSAALSGTEPKKVLVLDSIIGEQVYTAGGANIETVYIRSAGGTNVFEGLEKPWDAVSREDVLNSIPDFIIIHDYKGSSFDDKLAALKADPVLSNLDCIRNGCIIKLPLENVMPGMRSALTVETIARAMFPEQFNDADAQ